MNGRRIGIICSLLLLALYGCRNEFDTLPDAGDEMPVRFTAERPQDDVWKRAITDKEDFSAGDVMHVSARFDLADGGTVTKYATLTLDEHGEWNNETVFDMGWPWNATGAEFTAYYMEDWNGPINEPGRSVEPVVLDRYEFEGRNVNPDPLKAVTTVGNYGEAVHLRFEHLCSRLTIEDVGGEEEYELCSKYAPGNPDPVKNACRLIRNRDNTLAFEFVTEQSGKVSSQVFESEGKRAVTFHLAPGDYSRFSLTRRNGYAYLSVTNVDELGDLKANKAYTVSLENLQGNITPDEDDVWIETPDTIVPKYKEFSIDEFLNAIRECKEDYICKLEDGTSLVVLRKEDGHNEMLLMENVDFKGEDFAPVDLPNMVTFDGGGHSILNVAHPIFNDVYGTITQLNISAVKEPIVVEGEDTDWGMLARSSINAEISNIMLEGTKVEFTVPDNPEAVRGNTYNIGALVGWMRSGTLSDITLAGGISVTVDSEYEGVYIVCAGGVVGQCSGLVEHIDNFGSNSELRVTNLCKGNSSRYTGGVSGILNETVMNHCNLYALVDASESSGSWNYTGGISGAVRTTSGAMPVSSITGVTVTGSVTGGRIIHEADPDTQNHSSTGGIVGHVQSASVTEGAVLNTVSVEHHEGVGTNCHYTVGGVIGSMTNAVSIRKNEGLMNFNAEEYNLPGYTAGTFCGGGGLTDELSADGNSARGQGKFVGSDK